MHPPDLRRPPDALQRERNRVARTEVILTAAALLKHEALVPTSLIYGSSALSFETISLEIYGLLISDAWQRKAGHALRFINMVLLERAVRCIAQTVLDRLRVGSAACSELISLIR